MTREERLNRAREAVEAHKAVYYRDGAYKKADFWDYAEIFEIIDDLYEVSGDRTLFAQMEEMADFVLRAYGENWEKNPFNDDIMWLVIALTRAYRFTGEERYLKLARENFDRTFERAASEDLGGGLFWRIENQSKNTCVNCPGAVAASYLAEAAGDPSYWEKAAYCLDWAVKTMFEPETGKVYDCIHMDGRISRWSSTYNQGTFIGSCLFMWKHTGEDVWRQYALKAADYTVDVMYGCGIMNNEEQGNDLPGFKGILARYIRKLSDETGEEKYREWLRANADAAWKNRNAEGLMGTRLAEKTPDGTDFDVFSMSAAVSVTVNAV